MRALQITAKTECTQYVPMPQNGATALADLIYQVDVRTAWHPRPPYLYQLEKAREEWDETRTREDVVVNASLV
jgi:hypothetical protein